MMITHAQLLLPQPNIKSLLPYQEKGEAEIRLMQTPSTGQSLSCLPHTMRPARIGDNRSATEGQ